MKNKKPKTKSDVDVIRAKTLKWKKVKPEVFEKFSHNAEINVLKLNNKPAYYQVNKVNRKIQSTFWCGNQGMGIDDNFRNYSSVQEAKNACQKHYYRLIKENAIKAVIENE